ncbi:hypothetical protein ACREZD_10435, partial [Streptococcus pneumoniae]
YRPEYQKRKDEICPFSSLAFFQPTTVDKEPKISRLENSRIVPNLEISYLHFSCTTLVHGK